MNHIICKVCRITEKFLRKFRQTFLSGKRKSENINLYFPILFFEGILSAEIGHFYW